MKPVGETCSKLISKVERVKHARFTAACFTCLTGLLPYYRFRFASPVAIKMPSASQTEDRMPNLKQTFQFLVLIALIAAIAEGQSRTKISLNAGWKFLKADEAKAADSNFDDSKWQTVSVPHTYNVEDPWDDEPGHYRGPAWYRRELKIAGALKDKRIVLYFEGANQVSDVFVNGQKAGSHIGGYSAFAFDVTSLLNAGGRNVIAVRVDNTFNEDIPPLTADFNFYGGIYRDVWLIAANDLHFTLTDHASPGVRITTPKTADGDGTVAIDGTVVNSSKSARSFEVVSTVLDVRKKKVAEALSRVVVQAGSESKFAHSTTAVKDAKLWSPDSPYLYTVRNTIRENGKPVDEVVQPLGFRWFSFDGEKGFFLNGKHVKLRGTNRHQDHAGLGNALPDRLHIRDMELIKDAGFNYVRLAHYPQDPSVLEACDRLGLLVWEETPLVNYITKSEAFNQNSATMVREMVRQHRNHPSVLMWGYMNEIFLRIPTGRDDLKPLTVELARELNRIVKEEDPTRPTTIAFHGNDIYNTTGLGEVADVIGWNLYQGWYSGEFDGFGKFMDEQHKRYPKRPLIVSEYGANADRRLHSTEPRRFDSTIEWQRMFHESYLAQIDARPYIAGSAIWNQFDFGAEQRGETIPHLNQKGMYYFDRKPKDIHFFYKAHLSTANVLHIATRDWAVRSGTSEQIYPIDIYSNLSEVELIANGRSMDMKPVGKTRKATFEVTLQPGVNKLTARGTRNGKAVTDTTEIEYRLVKVTSPEIVVNVGSNADFTDAGNRIWLADQPYKKGEWGFLGDNAKRGYGLPPDPNILGTEMDPVFQTNVEGLSAYRFDVPAGEYDVELLFAEKLNSEAGRRVFSISANGRAVIDDLDIFKTVGSRRPLTKTFRVSVTSEGLEIAFAAKNGLAILNGIRVSHVR